MRHPLLLRRWAARRSRHRSRGQSLVELALILPVLMFLFAGAIDLGRVFYSQITIENAAKEGALEAAKHPTSFDNTKPCDKDTNRVLCLVLNESKGSMYEITPSEVTVSCSPSPCHRLVRPTRRTPRPRSNTGHVTRAPYLTRILQKQVAVPSGS